MRGFLGNIATALDRKSVGLTPELIAAMTGGGAASKAGVSVSVKTALQVTTVAACAARIAEGNATVPVKLKQKRAGDKDARLVDDVLLASLIEDAPNDHQNSLEFRETFTYWAILEGAAYAWINRVRGDIVELIPMEPSSLVKLDRSGPEWVYVFRQPDGSTMDLPAREVWHFRGPSWNTAEGMRAVQSCREAIGLAIAAEESQGLLHANGGQPGGLLSYKQKLSPSAKERLKALAADRIEGIRNAFRTLVLDGDATWTPFQMKGVDSQHLETRRFQVEEICRGLGVLPIMVGHADKAATYASAEQMFLHHVVHTVRPWHRRFEYSMDHQLLTPEQRRDGMYFHFVDTELLRGDHKARAEYYRAAIEAGWMLPEEPRAFEDMPYVPGLDRPRIPLNTGIVGADGQVQAANDGGTAS